MDEARLIALSRAVASAVVTKKPCFVYSICGIGLAQTSNVYRIYDGQDNTGKFMFTLVAGSYAPDFRLFAPPLYFAHGIYVEFTTNGEEMTVQYLQLG